MFSKRFRIFDLLGFPIYLDLSWFLIVILISWSLAVSAFPAWVEGLTPVQYWTMGIVGALGLFASILAHELGHAVMARRCDLPMRGITLFIFGGVADMGREPPNAKTEFLVAIAGPVVSVIIAVTGYAVLAVAGEAMPPSVSAVVGYLALINAILVAFNMVPAFPLDGGRVLRAFLWHIKGSLRWATRISSTLGSAFGMFLILLGLVNLLGGNIIGAIWQFLIGMFLRNAAQMSYQQVLIRRALEGEPVSRFMQPNVVSVSADLPLDELVDQYIYRHHYKMFPVVERDQLVGCVTTRDVQKIPREKWRETSTGEVLSACDQLNTTHPEADAMEALTQLGQSGASRMMVVDDGRLVGLLSLKDLMRFISLKLELDPLSDRPVAVTDPADSRPAKEDRIAETPYRR
jgi:Zn-dependent protease/CBS domain-containing protein